LEIYGIRGTPLKWFTSYLSQCQQQVKCNGMLSTLKFIKYGVPQGSILGPLLFLIYINDLPNVSSILHIVLFADDTNAFTSHKSLDTLFQIANHELNKLSNWFKANRLSLNLEKTNYIIFTSHRKSIPPHNQKLLIEDTPITLVRSVKFLGVYIDEHLTWKDHINKISLKIAKNIGIISRISYLLPINILINLYYALVYPYFSYCNLV